MFMLNMWRFVLQGSTVQIRVGRASGRRCYPDRKDLRVETHLFAPSEFRQARKRILFRYWILPLLMVACETQEAPVYQNQKDLLHYLDTRGRSRPVEELSHWSIRRNHTLQNMQRVMGPLPESSKAALDVEVLETEILPRVRRQKITFVSEIVDGRVDRVSGYLLTPRDLKPNEPAPAMLCLHQTISIGKAEPAGLGGSQDLHYALELARLGYVTLAPDYPGFGGYRTDPYALGYASATMKGIVNHRRAMDVLQSLAEVDPERIGVIGHSLGGHNSLFLAAFDERVKAVVTSCGFNSFRKYEGGNLKGWSHKGYMPRIALQYGSAADRMPFDFTEVLGSLAPRPVFISAPVKDDNFAVSGVKDCIESALPVYQLLFKSSDRLVWKHPDVGHKFPRTVRQNAYRFLQRWLIEDGGLGRKHNQSPAGTAASALALQRSPLD